MQLPALVMGLSLVWVASSCDTTHVNGYTAGNGVTGNTCPAVMAEGSTCKARCAVNSTSVGTIKCLAGELQDVSMCVRTTLLDDLSVVDVTKVMGSWDLSLTKPPNNVQLQSAVVSSLGMPKHFIECVWKGGDSHAAAAAPGGESHGPYRINYWVIVKPGMDPKIITDKIHGFSNSNMTQYQSFTHTLESFGMSMISIKEAVPPRVVASLVLKDPWGKNINPFGSSPGEGSGLASWQ